MVGVVHTLGYHCSFKPHVLIIFCRNQPKREQPSLKPPAKRRSSRYGKVWQQLLVLRQGVLDTSQHLTHTE